MKYIIFLLTILFSSCETMPIPAFAHYSNVHSVLYKGLIAEETSGNYQAYLAIASTVRNRLQAGLPQGLVALKRKDLNSFVETECAYARRTKNIDLKARAQSAISEVFEGGKDYAGGATHYEHTGVYKTPAWAKQMKVVKKLFPHTKREITFYKSQR